MRIKRIIIGILIGVVIGFGLDCINMVCAFFMPPFIVYLPLAILIGGCIGAVVKGTKNDRLPGTAQDLKHLPACVSEFIYQVIKKMRYRRKIRQDVRAELIAHFEDELRDYPAGRERDEKAKGLICEFGDAKLLAVLLRRAKKRCRPLWRTVVARSFQGLGVLILCFIFYVIWFLTGKPSITTNYVAELNNLVRPAADQSLNAAPLYQKAIQSSKELSDDFLVFFSQNYHDEEYKRELERIAKMLSQMSLNESRFKQMLLNQDSSDVQWLRQTVQHLRLSPEDGYRNTTMPLILLSKVPGGRIAGRTTTKKRRCYAF